MKLKTEDFLVHEGTKVELKKWPTLVKEFYKSKDHYEEDLKADVEALSDLQQLLYASNQYAVLLIFQAMDAAGKDGVIRHVLSGMFSQASILKAVRFSVSNTPLPLNLSMIFSGARRVFFPNAER